MLDESIALFRILQYFFHLALPRSETQSLVLKVDFLLSYDHLISIPKASWLLLDSTRKQSMRSCVEERFWMKHSCAMLYLSVTTMKMNRGVDG